MALEIWKPVVGYESYYEVSSLGNVRSLERIVYVNRGSGFYSKKKAKILSQCIVQGYCTVGLSKSGKRKHSLVHRLVLQAFTRNKKNRNQVNHINGDKTDNRLENLEWCNASENMTHAYELGLKNKPHQKGKNNNNAKLTESQAKKIKDDLLGGISVKALKKKYKVSFSPIYKIKNNTHWSQK